MPLRTHYDTLKVSRDAPIEVIQAAYRSLARKYHPDHNRSTPEGEATMKAINAAYEVLSDPAKRAEHDRWIAQQLSERSPFAANRPASSRRSSTDRGQSSAEPDWSRWLGTLLFSLCYFSIALYLLRYPGLRYIGILLLLGGLFYFRPRR